MSDVGYRCHLLFGPTLNVLGGSVANHHPPLRVSEMGSLDLNLDLQVVGQKILIPSVEEKSEIKSINQSISS